MNGFEAVGHKKRWQELGMLSLEEKVIPGPKPRVSGSPPKLQSLPG